MLADLLDWLTTEETRQRGIHQKQRHPTSTSAGITLGTDNHQIGDLTIGDEQLAAIEPPTTGGASRTGLHGGQVAAGAGFGHGDGPDSLATGHSRQPTLTLDRSADM